MSAGKHAATHSKTHDVHQRERLPGENEVDYLQPAEAGHWQLQMCFQELPWRDGGFHTFIWYTTHNFIKYYLYILQTLVRFVFKI